MWEKHEDGINNNLNHLHQIVFLLRRGFHLHLRLQLEEPLPQSVDNVCRETPHFVNLQAQQEQQHGLQ